MHCSNNSVAYQSRSVGFLSAGIIHNSLSRIYKMKLLVGVKKFGWKKKRLSGRLSLRCLTLEYQDKQDKSCNFGISVRKPQRSFVSSDNTETSSLYIILNMGLQGCGLCLRATKHWGGGRGGVQNVSCLVRSPLAQLIHWNEDFPWGSWTDLQVSLFHCMDKLQPRRYQGEH